MIGRCWHASGLLASRVTSRVLASSSSHSVCWLSSFSNRNSGGAYGGGGDHDDTNEEKVVLNNGNYDKEPHYFERTVYVHPLSQIILEYFQESQHQWIVSKNLDTALTIKKDGSFQLSLQGLETHTHKKGGMTSKYETPTSRIWTSYDSKEQKHWLNVVCIGGLPLNERFLLQDNRLPPWSYHRRKSLPEQVHFAVDKMIEHVDNSLDKATTANKDK